MDMFYSLDINVQIIFGIVSNTYEQKVKVVAVKKSQISWASF